ncbi:digalactosyldiacylglycerol synthase 2, chloroplastic-like [Chenopodium quinoa]|uniref:digalactosyldiacylglycerol synthase 2, chloroplastic-like n=1 Tax=Chenopodium quinoa TaxID=63459 RepID=UPI000B78F0FA|nr:digalactosyldiacylglycerol synthase 2, chloroplastic-like [Chenopodium quinoa]XP_021767335.1 digalactosyldiacylglycerol synthase 2, chloroplastic-like [Chenopodium quinoa]
MTKKQQIAIYTTASLPWMTGTAVNPLFRACYLAKDGERKVTLVIPWLSLKDQRLVYPDNIKFKSALEHEAYVRKWLEDRTGFISRFEIKFYPGRFSTDKRSILPVGDITEIISDEEADIAVLEEPEHLTWYHHGKRWKAKFRLVIGIVHTNYLEYVRREKNAAQAFLLKHINSWVIGIYCDKVIRLSAATQDLPRSIICNVHGVNPKFLETGTKKKEELEDGKPAFTKGAYYIGKMIWNKGYKELLKLLKDHQKELVGLEVDLYGNGEDSNEVKVAAKKLELPVRVHPGRDHADPLFHDYKVFLNPSTTDVVCTTTAEALAMGKIVVCANHPSNEFFKQFPNCRMYGDGEEFVATTRKALAEQPAPLTDSQRHELSWEAATERFLKAAELDQGTTPKLSRTSSKKFASLSSSNVKKKLEDASAYIHNAVSGTEFTRTAFGAIPGTLHPDDELCKELGLPSPTNSGAQCCRK